MYKARVRRFVLVMKAGLVVFRFVISRNGLLVAGGRAAETSPIFVFRVTSYYCPADHVPDWQPRVLLGMVEARSVNVKKTTTTTTFTVETVEPVCTHDGDCT